MLSENQVNNSFNALFRKDSEISEEIIEQAEILLEQLRPESPLRHRLSEQLQELREIHGYIA